MSLLSSDQKAALRADGQRIIPQLSVFKPASLLAAVVTGAPARGAVSISYGSGTGTGYAGITEGCTLLVGTAAGRRDVGMVRVKSVSGNQTSGALSLAGNSVAWAAGQHLTVLREYRLWGKPGRVDGSGVMQKDWSTAYSDQNSEPNPVAVAGPHRVGRMEEASLTRQVGASGNDTTTLSGGVFLNGSSVVIAGLNSGTTYHASLRLTNVPIPAGAVIVSAKLTVTAGGADSGTANLKIAGEAADNPAAPADYADFHGRSLTSAQVDWDITAAWAVDQVIDSPDITAIVQEIVNRAGWASGNAMQFFIRNDSGTAQRRITAYDLAPAKTAILTVVYETAVFDLDATGSYAVAPGATIASYLWSCTAGAIADTADPTTTLTLYSPNADGEILSLTVTDSNGKTHTTRRVVFAHDDGDDAPYADFSFNSYPSGSYDSGGWQMRLYVHGVADLDTFVDGALVVLWARVWYEGVEADPISLITGGENQLFAGYILGETIQADWETGTVYFQANSVTEMMQRVRLQPLTVEAKSGPAAWWQYLATAATVARYLHWLLHWHTTLLEICDVRLPTSNTLLKQKHDFAEGSLYTQVQDLAYRNGILAPVVANKCGQVWIETDAQYLTASERAALSVVSEITAADRREELVIVRAPVKKTGLANVKGFYFSGAAQTAIISKAPGDVPEPTGVGVVSLENLALLNQATGNALAGRVLAVENNETPEARIKFAGNYAVADLTPNRWWTMDVAESDTNRGIEWSDKNLLCRNVTINLDIENGAALVEAVFEPEAEGPDGVTGDYPKTPPDNPYPDGTTPGSIPPPPSWQPGGTINPAEEPTQTGTGSLVAWNDTNGVYVRLLAETNPEATWEARNGDLTGAAILDLHGCVDAHWMKQRQGPSAGAAGLDPARAILWRVGEGYIRTSTDAGKTWVDRTPVNNPPNPSEDSPAPVVADVSFFQIISDRKNANTFYVLGRWQTAGGDWRGQILRTADNGRTWEWLLGNGNGSHDDEWEPYDTTEAKHGWWVATVAESPDLTWIDCYPCQTDPTGLIGAWAAGSGFYNVGVYDASCGGLPDGNGYFLSPDILIKAGGGQLQFTIAGATGSQWHWYYRTASGWVQPGGSYGNGTHTVNVPDTAVQLAIHHCSPFFQVDSSAVTSLGFYNIRYGASADSMPLWADLSSDGLFLLLTVWHKTDSPPGSAGKLACYKFDIEAEEWSAPRQYALGDCTKSEAEAGTWVARPRWVPKSTETFYVYGRMQDPGGLGDSQIICLSLDDFVAVDISPAFDAADVCGALLVSGVVAGKRRFYAVRNVDGGDAELYLGQSSGLSAEFNYQSDIDFQVLPGGICVGENEILALGAMVGETANVVEAENAYGSWTDISGTDYPATGGVVAISVL